jgi:hypothetical protein
MRFILSFQYYVFIIIIIIIIIIINWNWVVIRGSSPYTSTDKTNNKYT